MAVSEVHGVDDPERLAALRRTKLLDSPPEESFDRLTRLASRVLNAPVALVSLVDVDRQFFKSCVGLPTPWSRARETPLSHSFCQYVVTSRAPFIVQDARVDPRVEGNGAIDDLGVVAYAGVPLLTSDGHALGSFCVIDSVQRAWTEAEIEILRDLAASAMTEIELGLEMAARRRAHEALRSGEAQLRRMIDSLIAFVGIMTPDGELLEANRPALEAAGLALEDVLGKPFEETYWWSYDATVQRQLREAIERAARGESIRYDVDVRVAGGQFITIDFMIAPMRDDEGRIIRLVPSAIDITDRKRTEDERARILEVAQRMRRDAEAATQAREAERNRLRQILDVIPEGIVTAESDQRFSLCNAAGAEILGVDLTDEPPLGARIGDFRPRKQDGSPIAIEEIPISRSLRRGETVRGERILVRRADTGEDRPILVSSAPLLDGDGSPLGAVAVFQDISEIIQGEQQKDDFVATVSHDLRSPITAIRGHAQILQRVVQRVEHPLAPRLNDGLTRIDNATRHMVQMLDDLVDLAYLAMHRDVALRLQPTDLTALSRDAVMDFQERSEASALQLLAESEVLGLVDGPRVRRALDNLISNALKYSPEGGEVKVRLRTERNGETPWAVIEVSDHGVGIPADDLPRIFDRYTRGGNVGGIKGTGLGLAGARQIAQQHGGDVQIESEVGRGTTARIRLPLEPSVN